MKTFIIFVIIFVCILLTPIAASFIIYILHEFEAYSELREFRKRLEKGQKLRKREWRDYQWLENHFSIFGDYLPYKTPKETEMEPKKDISDKVGEEMWRVKEVESYDTEPSENKVHYHLFSNSKLDCSASLVEEKIHKEFESGLKKYREIDNFEKHAANKKLALSQLKKFKEFLDKNK